MVRLAIAACALLGGCAIDADELPLGREQAPIINGEAINGDPAVVALLTGAQQFCTGTLVAPRVVVTAAHCLPPHLGILASEIDVFFGSRIDDPGTLIAGDEAAVHPDWVASAVPNDIGMLALIADAPVEPLHMIAAGQPAAAGETARLIGFGITEVGGADNGVKREGAAAIARSDESTIYLDAAPSLTCNGDSGGPLFVERGGAWVFAGIHSRSDCETESVSERVDVHVAERIVPFIAAHGGSATCEIDGVCDEDCEGDLDCGGLVAGDLQADLVGGCAAGGGGAGAGRSAVAGALAALGLALLSAGRARAAQAQAPAKARARAAPGCPPSR